MTKKVGSTIYMDSKLKEEAKIFFESYGLNLSSGINFLLKQTLNKNSLEFDDMIIEPVFKDDPDYKLIEDALKARKNGEKSYNLTEAKKILGF